MAKSVWYSPPKRRLRIRLKFVWEYIWIGILPKVIEYADYGGEPEEDEIALIYTFYVCLVPMLPIVIEWKHPITQEEFDAR